MFDGNGLAIANDAYLTLSFAADGVQVAGQTNALATKFDALAPASVWQEAILRAFQTWAVRTNADIGVVSDGGQPFGTPGASHDDQRFGDIRVAAIAMEPTIGAVSVPIDRIVGGTWQADVVFNTNFNFQSVNDIFAIALHESGHVFGLEDSDDPASPLHSGTIPTATEPTLTDTINLQALYGTRHADVNERPTDGGPPVVANDTFATATKLNVSEPIGGLEGSVPSLVYGDITSHGDRDFFRIGVPGDYSGPMTVTVRSAGVSLLAPHLAVYDSSQHLVEELTSSSTVGDQLAITIPAVAHNAMYFIEAEAASGNLYGIGGYSLTVSFDGINQPDLSTIGDYSNGTLRKLSPDELEKLLEPEAEDFFNEDAHADDNLVGATTLPDETDFGPQTRYEIVGSIADQSDRDFYRIRSPETESGPPGVLTASVRSLVPGQLVPAIHAFDRDFNPLPVTVLANGGGELIVKINGIASDRNYYVEVAANDPSGSLNTGNYQLTAAFRDQPLNLQVFAAGSLAADTGQNVHTVYVAEPQLFHFLIQAGSADVVVPTVLVATIFDESGQAVFHLVAPPGGARSQGAVLLGTGTYTVSIAALTLFGPASISLDYNLSGVTISDPFASDPNDQTTNPFFCPDPSMGGAYCYPGNIITDDPYLWDDFINSLPDPPPPIDLQQLVPLMLGDWWSWFWAQTGTNGPPLAQSDSFQTSSDTTLNVSKSAGVLSNDLEPESNPMTAVLASGPSSGQLQFNSDGSFQYTPEPGYNGLVRFSYQASDFTQLSNLESVTIAVGLIGDYDHDGAVNLLDYGVWQASFGSTSNLAADGNGDGVVDAADYTLWRDHLGAAPTMAGDYNHNGEVESLDYELWRTSFGSTLNLAADGNFNGVVDAADYTVWRDHLSVASVAGAGSAAVGEPPVASVVSPPVQVNVTALAPRPIVIESTFPFASSTINRSLPLSAVSEAGDQAESESLLILSGETRSSFSLAQHVSDERSYATTDAAFAQLESSHDDPRVGVNSGIEKAWTVDSSLRRRQLGRV